MGFVETVHSSAIEAEKFRGWTGLPTIASMNALHLVDPKDGERPAVGSFYSDHPLALIEDAAEKLPPLSRSERLALALGLARGTRELLRKVGTRVAVRFEAAGDVWELGLERCRTDVLVSVYRPSSWPRVVVHERRVRRDDLIQDQIRRLSRAGSPSRPNDVAGARRSPSAAARRALTGLESLEPAPACPPAARAAAQAVGPRIEGLRFSAAGDFKLPQPGGVDSGQVERSDLHALLIEGSLSISAGATRIQAPRSQLYPDAQRLLQGAGQVLAAWESGRPLACRLALSGLQISLSGLGDEGPIDVHVVNAQGDTARKRPQRIQVQALTWVRAVGHFVEALCGTYREADERQRRNLRLVALHRRARALLQRALAEEGSHENPRPDSYRRFARRRRSMASGIWERGGKMRFTARWVATVPGLDLRSTFLCGSNLIVDSSRETVCIDRKVGKIVWRAPSGPAARCVSPAGLIRFRADGQLSCVDVTTGEDRFSLQLKPRTGGGAAGSLVDAEGLPKLLALTDGDHQISAINLLTGELAWRHTSVRAGCFRLRRVGKLLLVVGGSGTLFALDLLSGEAVWRHCSRAPFSGSIAVDTRSAVAVSGVPGAFRLQHVDPWSGRCLWSVALSECPLPGRHPLLTDDVVVVPVGDERSAGAEAFDRATGRCLWRHRAELASATSAWAACNDVVIVNDATGVLTCIEARSGRLLFNHVFAGSSEADTPRRLEPVLRHGALFVPQQQVHVLRPRSGEVIGTVPRDLVPDLLRVDERCDVYVGEESGHLAAFTAAPRLALVG